VDDDSSVSSALRTVLRSHGFSTEQFASAESFLEFPNLENAWCLITDVRLTGMSGLQLQQRMMDTTPNLPIIFITATRDDTIRARALNGGAIGFFYKPVVLEDLLACLTRTFADRKA
jgi:FixJ family two-component response regulator